KAFNNYLLLLLSAPVQFGVGLRFYRGMYDALRNRMGNMDTLIATGTTCAWVYSLIVTVDASSFPSSAVYFDTATLIITLVLLGNTLEYMSKGKASEAVRKLLDLQSLAARIVRDGTEADIPVEEVQVGDIFVLRPGERVPVDGVVVEGRTSIDQSMITGESMPVEKRIGDQVIGGTINRTGFIRARAEKVGADTLLSKIIQLVEEAQMARAPIQRLADRVSGYFVPAVLGIGSISALAWYFLGHIGLNFALLAFVSVVIIACPCALGIATPAAVMVGTAKGAQHGILIKGGEHLEAAQKVDTVVFDKTGTLTRGEPTVTDIVAFSGFSRRDVLRYAAIAEKRSEHALSEAVQHEARRSELRISDPETFEAVPGMGVKCRYNGHEIKLGNMALMTESGSVLPVEAERQISTLEGSGKTAMILSVDGRVIGLIGVADTIKDHSAEAIKQLEEMGIQVIMVTGDNERTARTIAEKLGIKRVLSEVLPDQKEKVVREIQHEHRRVAMVGDGVNDAPALAAADLGIAIGSGTDVAVETGGIVLIRDDPRDVVTAIRLSKHTLQKIKQNLFWAFAYNAILIPVAAGVLVPFLGAGVYDYLPFLAAGAMAFSSVTVVSNSLLLSRFNPATYM
ncbi:MAG TPA: copper-translocating P-type ATPase, partial [Candidatus Acidoferrum sp.]|nr:copper-translocating P-type ATPase [Candidatus Acidoferrum sp.]